MHITIRSPLVTRSPGRQGPQGKVGQSASALQGRASSSAAALPTGGAELLAPVPEPPRPGLAEAVVRAPLAVGSLWLGLEDEHERTNSDAAAASGAGLKSRREC